MRVYQTNQIRNIALLGHLGSGKTTIAESLLFVSGGLTSKGTIENKNTVSDYMDEEKIKQGSLSTSLIPIEWADMKLNFLDVPGTEELDNEIKQVLNIVKGAILVVDGTKGVEIGTLRLWKQLTAAHVPTVIFVNKMDKENIKFDTVIDDIRNKLGKQAIPFLWPIGKEADFEGFVNCVEMKAFVFDDKGTKKEVEIWEEKEKRLIV